MTDLITQLKKAVEFDPRKCESFYVVQSIGIRPGDGQLAAMGVENKRLRKLIDPLIEDLVKAALDIRSIKNQVTQDEQTQRDWWAVHENLYEAIARLEKAVNK